VCTRGRRLSSREIENGPSFVGHFASDRTKHGESSFETLTLHSGNPAEQKALPDLYEPVLVGLAPNTFVLRRYERVDTSEGGIGVVQEWHCRDL